MYQSVYMVERDQARHSLTDFIIKKIAKGVEGVKIEKRKTS